VPGDVSPKQPAAIADHGAYWVDGMAPLPTTDTDIAAEADVVIIGSGYTGMHAAIVTARAGKTTQVLDAETPGWGCSTRNGGQISSSVKPSLAELTKRFGSARARAIRAEGDASLDWIETFIKDNNIECDFMRSGRFHAAHTPRHFDMLVREAAHLGAEENVPTTIVSRHDQHSELGSDIYYGGVVFERHAAVHPAKYYAGILQTARAAGVRVTGRCPALNITKSGAGYCVSTPKGQIKAGKVVIATNGYSGDLMPWVQRRVIPIGSYIIATDPLPKALMDRLFPTNRIISDTCKIIYYFRPSPDRSRVLFGGRVSANETNPAISGPKLKQDMCRIFPELQNFGLSHSWCGTVAYSFDELMHIGVNDGVHYAMGYCGSGVGMASYLGMRLGQQVLALPEGKTAFDNIPFPTRPLYTGNPWFLPAMVRWYRWRDQWQIHHAFKYSANKNAEGFAENA
jgi:glycine/D-amino acid oxidase-like deaminating enzyme